MLADVAKPCSAQQGVGDGMEHDVSIAVPGKPAVMRHGNSAEHNRPVPAKGMHIEAEACAGDQARRQQLLGAGEVGGIGQLVEHRIALDGGPDGIEVHRRVAADAATWLRPGGTLLIETGRRQADGTAAACTGAGLAASVVVREMSTLVRAISAGSGSSGTMAR